MKNIGMFFAILFLALSASAQDTQDFFESHTSFQDHAITPARTKKWFVDVIAQQESNLQKSDSPDHRAWSRLSVEPRYQFNAKSQVSVQTDFSQSYSDDKTSAVSNSLILGTPWVWAWGRDFSFQPDVSYLAPTNADDRNQQSYRGTFSLRPTLDFHPAKVKWLSLRQIVFLSRNLHEFTLQRDFSPNVEYSVRARFIADIVLRHRLKLEFLNDYVSSWTYQGFQHEEFYFAQTLSYEWMPTWIALLSHRNEGSLDGNRTNGESLALLNPQTSILSLGVGHEF